MSIISSIAMAPYKGDIGLIDKFYEILGFEVDKGIVKLDNFEIYFGSEQFSVNSFQIVIELNSDLDKIEDELLILGCKIDVKGFDFSGPYLITKDPSGLNVRIGLSQQGISEWVTNSIK